MTLNARNRGQAIGGGAVVGPSPMVKYMKSTQVWHSKTGSWWWWWVVQGSPLVISAGCGWVAVSGSDGAILLVVRVNCIVKAGGSTLITAPPPLCNQSGQIPVKPTPSPLFSAAEDKQIVTHLTLMSMPHPVFLLAPPAPGTSHFQWAVKGFLSKPDMRLRI